jgi:hypothetical protein
MVEVYLWKQNQNLNFGPLVENKLDDDKLC